MIVKGTKDKFTLLLKIISSVFCTDSTIKILQQKGLCRDAFCNVRLQHKLKHKITMSACQEKSPHT